MEQFYFRLRFYFPPHHSINSDTSTLEISITSEQTILRLSPQDGDGTIKSARHMVLAGGPYSTLDMAHDAGTRARHALIQYSIKSRVGIDLGKDRATGGLSKYAKDKIAQDIGIHVINDVHGLLVYAGTEDTKFIRGNRASIISNRDHADFLKRFKDAYVQDYCLTDKQSVAFELFSASHFELSPRSRFITLVMAIEALMQPLDREKEAQEHVTALIDLTANSGLSSDEKQSLEDSLRWLYKESIGNTGRKMANRLSGKEQYAGKNAAAFFTKCYSFRSQLMHKGTITDGNINLDAWLGELERFVADLLNASIRPLTA